MFGLFGKKESPLQTYKKNINASMESVRIEVEKIVSVSLCDYLEGIDQKTFKLALYSFIYWGFCKNLERVFKLQNNQIEEVMGDIQLDLFVQFAIKDSMKHDVLDIDKIRSNNWNNSMDKFNIYLTQTFSEYHNAYKRSIPMISEGSLLNLPLANPFLNEVFGSQESEKIKKSFVIMSTIPIFFAEMLGEFEKIIRYGHT
jgi:hypothetical protein